jgi:hypothetical protein
MNASLDKAKSVAFEDQRYGIVFKDKAEHHFEAFQQAEGSTSRKYGGTVWDSSIAVLATSGRHIELDSEVGRAVPLPYTCRLTITPPS